MIYVFENGKGVRISMKAYETKSRRKKMSGICSSDSPLVAAIYEEDKPKLIFLRSDGEKGMLIKSDLIPIKSTRTASGVQIMQFPRKKGKVELATENVDMIGEDAQKCRKLVIPSMGVSLAQLNFKF
jgi:DNA gyrase subunit A